MEGKASIKVAMVSKLPKFGGRSTSCGAHSLSNSSIRPTTSCQDVKPTSVGSQSHGGIRTSSFSFKWKRDERMTLPSPTSPPNRDEDKTQTQLPTLPKEVKTGTPGTPKILRSGSLIVCGSNSKATHKESSKMNPKVETKLGQNQLNGGQKIAQTFSNIPARTGSESRLARPKLGSSSPRSISQDSLSQSTDSLKTLSLDNIVRSNSFTHVKQIPSPTNQSMIRSFSFNRAIELAKPLANTQLRPPRNTFLKPPQLSNGRVGLGIGGLNGNLKGSGGLDNGLEGNHNSRTPSIVSPRSPGSNASSGLKKPLFPSCLLTKSTGGNGGPLGFRMTRSGQAKQQKSLFSGRVKGDLRPSTAPEYRELLDIEPHGEAEKNDSHSDSDGSSGERGGSVPLRQSLAQAASETLEDMSISSASSIDRCETSEEFIDDFDSVGDVLSDVDEPDDRKPAALIQISIQDPLQETIDWSHVDVEECEEESPMQDSQGPLVLSSEQSDNHQASSVELSPSNSSGGTYMWDEEGLEPLVGRGTNVLDSFDESEHSSMDILNNLDHRGIGELADDDLVLDVDLSEDGLYDMDSMSHSERSVRGGRQGQRRRHHRWSGCNDSRAHVFQQYDGLKPSRPVASEGRHHGYTTKLDELTLEHMTQDCSSLKYQLLKLKTLLQLEDTDSKADAPEEVEDKTTAAQLEEVMKEVQVLRDELRSRDKTIAQLTLQCEQLQQQQQQHQREQLPAQGHQIRCQCHHQKVPSSLRQGDRQTSKRTQRHNDKATQTYWRPPSQAPQILLPSSPCLSELLHQERIVKTPTEGHSDFRRTRSEEGTCVHAQPALDGLCAGVSVPSLDDERSNLLLSYHLHSPSTGSPQGVNAGDSPASVARSAAQHETRAPSVIPDNSIPPVSAALTCPRLLQPPRLHKRVSLPSLHPGGGSGRGVRGIGSSVRPLGNQTTQLPPPSRGLPCFNSGQHVQTPSLRWSSLLQPGRVSEPCMDSQDAKSSREEPDSQRPMVREDAGFLKQSLQTKDSLRGLNPNIKT